MKNKKEWLKKIEGLLNPYRIKNGKGFKLNDIDPGDTAGIGSGKKEEAEEMLASGVEWLADLQDKLYAHDHYGLLVIFQAMDAAGNLSGSCTTRIYNTK